MIAQIYLACILAGCMALQGPQIAAGDALALNEGAVRVGIQTALSVSPAVARYLSPDKSALLVSWPLASHQAWSFVTSATAGLEQFIGSSLSGQIANVKDWTSVRQLAEALKWAPVTIAEAEAFLQGMGPSIAIIYKRNPMLALTMAITRYLESDPMRMINPGVDS
jgi:hypothetical protein